MAWLNSPEPLPTAELSRSLRRLFEALDIPLGRPVLLGLLLLRGGKPGVHLETAPVSKLGGLDSLRLYYHAFGLSDALAEYYLERPEPLAWALAAHMSPRRLDRAALKKACRKRIGSAGLATDCRRLLLREVTKSGSV